MPAPGGAPAGAMRMLAQLRTALAARTVTAAGIAAVYRYRDPGEVRGDLDGLRAAGLIDAAGDGAIEATETGRAVLAGMYQAGAEVTGQLWSQHGNALAGLNDLAGRVVQAGLATGGDAYLTMAPPYEPGRCHRRCAAPSPVVGIALPPRRRARCGVAGCRTHQRSHDAAARGPGARRYRSGDEPPGRCALRHPERRRARCSARRARRASRLNGRHLT